MCRIMSRLEYRDTHNCRQMQISARLRLVVVRLCVLCSISNILQMVGRAGRPGYDDTGVAVIMTSKEHQERYENLSKGQEIVESQLPQRFLEGKSQCQKASRGEQLRDCRREPKG